MPLSELDPNVSGRASRASYTSVSSRGTRRTRKTQQPPSEMLSTGVVSMLRTSTELGDIAGLAMGSSSRASALPRPARRSNHASRLSISSAQTQVTRRTSTHQARPSSARSVTSSLNVPQFVPDTLSPTQMNLPGTSPLVPHARSSRDARSFSLTTTGYAPLPKLTTPRSFSSLRHADSLHRPRSPYRYPTRLKRPGYRSPSPAMSDVTGLQPRRIHQAAAAMPRLRSPVSPLLPHEMEPLPYNPHFNRSTPVVSPLAPDAPPLPMRHPLMARNGSAPVLRPAIPLKATRSLSSRTDSDDPSSGPPSLAPATPKGASSFEVMIHPAATASGESLAVQVSSIAPSSHSTELLYYDYSEHFENIQSKDSTPPRPPATAPTTPLGFVERIKTILEEQAAGEPGCIGHNHDAIRDFTPLVELPATPPPPTPSPPPPVPPLPEAVELPASPIPRRITREMILSIIEPSSTIEPTASTDIQLQPETVPEPAPSPAPSASSTDTMSTAQENPPTPPPKNETEERRSSETETTSTVTVPSSTVNVALKYAAPQSCDSAESTEAFTLGQPSEPQVVTEDGSPAPASEAAVDVENPLPATPSTAENSPNPSPMRAKSMNTPRNMPAGVMTRFSEPLLGVPVSQAESQEPSKFSVEVSVSESPMIATTVTMRIHEEISTSSQAQSPEEALRVLNGESARSPITFAIEESPAGNATVQSTTTMSVPARPLSTQDMRDSNNTTTHLVWPIRRQSLPPYDANDESVQRDSVYKDNSIVNDFRLSNAPRYSIQLSDVKEEPSEEGSAPDLRASRAFKFPLPRGLGRSASLEEIYCRDSTTTATTSTARNSANTMRRSRGLAESRLIPSMNFSRMDLFAKLNEALEAKLHDPVGGRGTLSLDGVPHNLDPRDPFNEPRQSYGPMREKYRSFFASLDEMDKDQAPAPELRPKTPDVIEPVPEEKEPTMTVATIQKSYCPEDLLTEVERLSIPSVSGLTQRLSELLPALKRYGSKEPVEDTERLIEDSEIKSDVEEIRHLGDRPGLLNSVKSSARLRPLPGKNVLVVIEDDVYEELTQREKNPDKQASGEYVTKSVDSSRTSSNTSLLGRKDPVSCPSEGDARILSLAELEAPMPAHVRTSMRTGADDPEDMFSKKTGDGRHWDLSMKFPWNNSGPAVDISFPAKVLARDDPSPGPSKLRGRLSMSSEYSTDTLGQPRNATGDHTFTTESTETQDTFKHTGRASKPSVLGSFPRKVRLGHNHTGYPVGPDGLVIEDHTVNSGDRYPTTSLNTPAHFNLDEVRSFFSDDSSHHRPTGGLRKRLTHLRSKVGGPHSHPHSRPHTAMDAHHSIDVGGRGFSSCGNNAKDSFSGDSRLGAGGSVHTYDGATAMPKSEYRTKRFFEKIKNVWFRTGALLKSISGKRRAERQEMRLWLRDSDMDLGAGVYEGT